MRLADFILANTESILAEWEVFARSIWPGAATDPATLRDHAQNILRATALDMKSDQSAAQQSDKSKGKGPAGVPSGHVDRASVRHAIDRVGWGFELVAVVAEYRALRASVLRLWRESRPSPDLRDVEDLTRFNESIDQSLTEAVRGYTEQVERVRKAAADEREQRDRDVREVSEALLVSSIQQHELRDRAMASMREAKEEAETANRAKDMFLATLSHELRTPLNAIVGWMSILRAQGCNEKDMAEGLDVIERNTGAQMQLIEDILDVSRIVSGKLRLEIRPFELMGVINAGISAVRPAAEAKGITLHVRLDPSASRGSGDPARIQQVVWNLVSNAVKFTPKKGRIDVTLAREQSNLRIQVTDNGLGISADLLPHVFDRFRQADSSTRRKYGGLGLGLSVVKHLVEGHGGTIEAQSAGEGRGSTFIVRLPIKAVQIDEAGPDEEMPEGAQSSGKPIARPPSGVSPARLDGLHVLVVDDEADARRLLTIVLEQAGAIVETAANAQEAFDILVKVQPAVLISDLGLPGQDGFDLIHEVRRRGHGVIELPAVALTAFVREDDERQALAAGYQVHVAKPVDPHELISVVASLAGRTA